MHSKIALFFSLVLGFFLRFLDTGFCGFIIKHLFFRLFGGSKVLFLNLHKNGATFWMQSSPSFFQRIKNFLFYSRNFLSFLLSFMVLFFCVWNAVAVEIPYETCDWTNKEYTENLINTVIHPEDIELEAGSFCIEDCEESHNNSLDQKNIDILKQAGEIGSEAPSPSIPDLCFFASMLRSNKKSSYLQCLKKENSAESNKCLEKWPDDPSMYRKCLEKECSPQRDFYYCSRPDDLRHKTSMSFANCDSQTKTCSTLANQEAERELETRRLCLNKDYVRMTAQAFHTMADCFQFSPREKERLFGLFNHESSFMLNSRSDTGARCYGQVTSGLQHLANRYIFFSGKSYDPWPGESRIYQSAVEECAFLPSKLALHPQADNQELLFQEWNKEVQRLKNAGQPAAWGYVDQYDKMFNQGKGSSFTCSSTTDPYTCLFYSMYYYKINEAQFERTYNDLPGAKLELPEDIMQLQVHPIKINEMLIFEGVIRNAAGRTQEVRWLIADSYELYDMFVTKEAEIISVNKVQKVNVFPKDVLRTDAVKRAHNGGGDIVGSALRGAMNQLKRKIAGGASCNLNETCKRQREAIFSGEMLTEVDADTSFYYYLRGNHKDKNTQASVFIRMLEKHSCILHNEGSKTDNLEVYLSQLNHGISDFNESQWIQQVKERCPKAEFEPKECQRLQKK